jgi:acyl dehydratase
VIVDAANLTVGTPLPEMKKTGHNPYVRSSQGTELNIHDDAVAQRIGFKGGFVAGGRSLGMIAEMLLTVFGPSMYETGRYQATYVSPVYEGDEVTIKGVVRERLPEDGKTRVVCDVWVEKADGTKAVVGTASALV